MASDKSQKRQGAVTRGNNDRDKLVKGKAGGRSSTNGTRNSGETRGTKEGRSGEEREGRSSEENGEGGSNGEETVVLSKAKWEEMVLDLKNQMKEEWEKEWGNIALQRKKVAEELKREQESRGGYHDLDDLMKSQVSLMGRMYKYALPKIERTFCQRLFLT
ncbi:MAG: hypothetical protein ACRCYP_05415 [Alphaproteobacteria bacterium]